MFIRGFFLFFVLSILGAKFVGAQIADGGGDEPSEASQICREMTRTSENYHGLIDHYLSLKDVLPDFLNLDAKTLSTLDVLNGEGFQDCSTGDFRQLWLNFKERDLLLIYSNEDSCDGGNSYGLVYDPKTKESIVQIRDSDLYCR